MRSHSTSFIYNLRFRHIDRQTESVHSLHKSATCEHFHKTNTISFEKVKIDVIFNILWPPGRIIIKPAYKREYILTWW